LFLPAAVLPVFKQIRTAALVLQTARTGYTSLSFNTSVSEEHGILMACPKSINFRTWCHRNIAETSISQVKAERESYHYNRTWRPVDL
jgi:hypothetical protein